VSRKPRCRDAGRADRYTVVREKALKGKKGKGLKFSFTLK
jgi:hypothetical protein